MSDTDCEGTLLTFESAQAAVTEADIQDATLLTGRHKGQPFTRVPLSYLQWMVNVDPLHSQRTIAVAELQRRGCVGTPSCTITPHAIDRASIRCWKTFRDTRQRIPGYGPEGLHMWLSRLVDEALKTTAVAQNTYIIHGLKMIIQCGVEWPVLVTVNPVQKGYSKR